MKKIVVGLSLFVSCVAFAQDLVSEQQIVSVQKEVTKYQEDYQRYLKSKKASTSGEQSPALVRKNRALVSKFLAARIAILDHCARTSQGNREYVLCLAQESTPWNDYVFLKVYQGTSPAVLSDIQTLASLIAYHGSANLSGPKETLFDFLVHAMKRSNIDIGENPEFYYTVKELFYPAQTLGYLESLGASAAEYPRLHIFAGTQVQTLSEVRLFQETICLSPCGSPLDVAGEKAAQNYEERIKIVQEDYKNAQNFPDVDATKKDALEKLKTEFDQLVEKKKRIHERNVLAIASQNQCVAIWEKIFKERD